jgi:BlaI family transcriptional regulator, penicillinase repressor
MSISESEALIMHALWENSPLTASELLDTVGAEQAWQESTVKSLLSRLVHKRAVRTRKDGRRFLYYPVLSRTAYLHGESKSLVDRLFGGRMTPFVAHFLEQQKLSKRDLAELRELLRELDDD